MEVKDDVRARIVVHPRKNPSRGIGKMQTYSIGRNEQGRNVPSMADVAGRSNEWETVVGTKPLRSNERMHERLLPGMQELQRKKMHVGLPCEGNAPIACDRPDGKTECTTKSTMSLLTSIFSHQLDAPTEQFRTWLNLGRANSGRA